MKRTFTVKPKSISASSDTRSRISNIEQRIAQIQNRLQDEDLDEFDRVSLNESLMELQQELNFAWQDDEQEYNEAFENQEFNSDGSLKGYGELDDDYAPTFTVCIWYEIDPGRDAIGPVAAQEFFDFVADSPQQALNYARNAWQGPIDRIEVVAIDGEPVEDVTGV